MGKSLFRLADILELSAVYFICFVSNFLFDYVKTLHLESYMLKAFFSSILDYQNIIEVLLTFIVIVYHYQMVHRKKTEVYCRIVVGDTLQHIALRYALDCLKVLGLTGLFFIAIKVYFSFNLTRNIYLVFIFILYILISASQVWKYESI